MHPILILIPVAGAVFGPRLWAQNLMARYDDDDPELPEAADLARALLDKRGLGQVRVEVTDLGAHYDPVARAVRVPRARFHRRSLTGAVTVAHEVGHALQDAEGYWPFRLHLGLGRVARISGEIGTALLLAVPVAALAGQGPLPTLVVGGGAAAMLGTSLGAQLAALPSELNASFGRALPMLASGSMPADRVGQARWLLLACSTTYLSASLNPMLLLWTWFGVPLGGRVAQLRAIPDAAYRPRRSRSAHGGPGLSQALNPALNWGLNRGQNRALGGESSHLQGRSLRDQLASRVACPAATAINARKARQQARSRAASQEQGRPGWAVRLQDCARPWVRAWLRHQLRTRVPAQVPRR
jgi:hypothetical protein